MPFFGRAFLCAPVTPDRRPVLNTSLRIASELPRREIPVAINPVLWPVVLPTQKLTNGNRSAKDGARFGTPPARQDLAAARQRPAPKNYHRSPGTSRFEGVGRTAVVTSHRRSAEAPACPRPYLLTSDPRLLRTSSGLAGEFRYFARTPSAFQTESYHRRRAGLERSCETTLAGPCRANRLGTSGANVTPDDTPL